MRLKRDRPFHSPTNSRRVDYTRAEFEDVEINLPATVPCILKAPRCLSCLESVGRAISKSCCSDSELTPCEDTVQWWDSMQDLYQERGVRRWIGIGSGKVGQSIVAKEVGGVEAKGDGVWAIRSPTKKETICSCLGAERPRIWDS